MNEPNTFDPEALRRLRAEAGLSQQKLADLAGMTDAGVCLLEQGKRKPRPGTVAALARALDADPSDLWRAA